MGKYYNDVIKVSSQKACQNNAGRYEKEAGLQCLGRLGQPGASRGPRQRRNAAASRKSPHFLIDGITDGYSAGVAHFLTVVAL